MATDSETCTLAWAGWSLPLPAVWRPLRVTGGSQRGTIVIGDGIQALFQIKWMLANGRPFDPHRWLARHVRGPVTASAADLCPFRAEGFETLAWFPAGTGHHGGSLWYGYALDQNLLLEISLSGDMPVPTREHVQKNILSGLRAASGPTVTWAVFSAVFAVPADYRLVQHRLHLGDIALSFVAFSRQRLVLRQIYPATLALGRRSLARWLECPPFAERRRSSDVATNPWAVTINGRMHDGLVQTGNRCLAFPFGRVARRTFAAGLVHDTGLDRLLYAAHESRSSADPSVIAQAIGRMNSGEPATPWTLAI